MTRIEILEVINDIIEEEHGVPVKEDYALIDSELDSFGTVTLFLELDTRFKCFPKEWLQSIEVEDLFVKELVDRIENEGTK